MRTCKVEFVSASEIFHGYRKIWLEFFELQTIFSWGGNSHSLVQTDALVDALQRLEGVAGTKVVIARLRGLPAGVYVDLEG